MPPQTSTTGSTSTTVPPAAIPDWYATDGGSVAILVSAESVTFGGGSPANGWNMEVEDYGPEKVEVHFEEINGGGEIEFEARIRDGKVVVSIS